MDKLTELRAQIDAIDGEMVALLIKRLNIAAEIAEYKRENEIPAYDKQREKEVIASASALAGELGGYAESFMNVVIGLSKAHQNETSHE